MNDIKAIKTETYIGVKDELKHMIYIGITEVNDIGCGDKFSIPFKVQLQEGDCTSEFEVVAEGNIEFDAKGKFTDIGFDHIDERYDQFELENDVELEYKSARSKHPWEEKKKNTHYQVYVPLLDERHQKFMEWLGYLDSDIEDNEWSQIVRYYLSILIAQDKVRDIQWTSSGGGFFHLAILLKSHNRVLLVHTNTSTIERLWWDASKDKSFQSVWDSGEDSDSKDTWLVCTGVHGDPWHIWEAEKKHNMKYRQNEHICMSLTWDGGEEWDDAMREMAHHDLGKFILQTADGVNFNRFTDHECNNWKFLKDAFDNQDQY